MLENLTVDGRGGLASAIHWDHSDSNNPNSWNVTIRNLKVTGTQQAVIFWEEGQTVRNVTIDGATISGALANAVTYRYLGTNIVLKDITSTGSGQVGLYAPAGMSGLTLVNTSFK